MPRLGAALGLGLWLLALAGPALAEIYGWVDERGVPHYSDRIEDVPEAYRSQLDLETEEESGGSVNMIEGLGQIFASEEDEEGEAAGFEPNVDAFEARRFAEQLQGPALLIGGFVALVMLGLVLAVATWVLLISCQLVGQESPGFRKGYGIVVVQFLAGAALTPGVVVVVGEPDASSLGSVLTFQAIQMGVSLAVSAMVLRAMLCDTFPRALGLAIVITIVAFALGAIMGLGIVTCAGGAAILASG
ncbi:MAG: DUF4124 domain-containing protein [Myxococcota bacterium]|nr:DUF4124 domain-containing protein [Myxococcota bacterium]